MSSERPMSLHDRIRERRQTRRSEPARAGSGRLVAPEAGFVVPPLPMWLLELAPGTAPAAAPAAAADAAAGNHVGTVLIVDECPATRAQLRARLAARGWACYEAADARAALALQAAVRADAVVLELELPEDGVRVLRALRRLAPATRVIGCAAEPQRALVAAAFEAGAVDVLAKPLREDRLVGALAG